MSTHLNLATQRSHADDLRRSASEHRRVKSAAVAAQAATASLRPARAADAVALERLAALDSSAPLAGPLLVAAVGGELHAAVGILDDRAIADPFHHTAHLVQQLRKEARALRRRERRATRLRRRVLARRPAPASA